MRTSFYWPMMPCWCLISSWHFEGLHCVWNIVIWLPSDTVSRHNKTWVLIFNDVCEATSLSPHPSCSHKSWWLQERKVFIKVQQIWDSEYEDHTPLRCDIPFWNVSSHVAYSFILKVMAAYTSETLVSIVPSHMESHLRIP